MRTAKRGKGSRNKGAAFENHIAKILTEYTGWKWVRTPLSGGWSHSKEFNIAGDLVSERKVRLFIECKKEEAPFPGLHILLNSDSIIYKWFRSIEVRCKDTDIPCLVFSKNYFPVFFLLKRKHFKEFDYKGNYFVVMLGKNSFVVGEFKKLVECQNFISVITEGGGE